MELRIKVRVLVPEPAPEPAAPTRGGPSPMKLDKTCALFFGTKIDSKLREALSQIDGGLNVG